MPLFHTLMSVGGKKLLSMLPIFVLRLNIFKTLGEEIELGFPTNFASLTP